MYTANATFEAKINTCLGFFVMIQKEPLNYTIYNSYNLIYFKLFAPQGALEWVYIIYNIFP